MVATFSPLADLSLDDVVAIARQGAQLEPIHERTPRNEAQRQRLDRIRRSAQWVQSAMREIESAAERGTEPPAYYGINTGFGDNAGRATFQHVDEAERLSRNILISHTVGVGEHLPEDVVRAALAIRVVGLSKGYSGVRIEVLNTLIEMLNRGVYPAVPSQGSLGASGDLAPLAHLFLPMSMPLPDEDTTVPGATGYCYLNWRIVTGAEAMAAAGIAQVRLGAKEGLALTNGTAITLALALLALHDASQIIRASQMSLAMSVDALRGFRDAFLPHINALRSPEQAQAARTILDHLRGSTLARGDVAIDLPASEGPPQDPYCIRCAPAVLGAVMSTLRHVESVLATELNAVTDNPLVFSGEPDDSESELADDELTLPRRTKVISGGNFHGAPLGYAMDFLAIALADLASIAERRVFMLTDARLNRGLPAFLMPEPPQQVGLNSGLMIAQYTAAALVSENKSLAHPASVDSIPSSANREDHVSMSSIAARKAAQIVINARQVIAIELLCASQALSLRLEAMPDQQAGEGSGRALNAIRGLKIADERRLDVIRQDTPLGPYVSALVEAIRADVFR